MTIAAIRRVGEQVRSGTKLDRWLRVAVVVSLISRAWVVVMIAAAVCAVFASHAIAALLAPVPLPIPAPGPAPVPPSMGRPARVDHRAGDSLVSRNMFCSTCRATSADGPMAATHGDLIATILGETPGATIRVLDTEIQGMWTLGDRVPGLGRIARITATSIDVLDLAGQRRTLSLRTTVAGPRDAGAATPATGPATWVDAQITKLDEQTYRVDRALVAALVSGTTALRGVRATPVIEHGELRGLRLSGVSARSVAGALGLRSGDVVNAINGEAIKSIDQLLGIYARLDQMQTVELQGARRGQPLTRTLVFR